jgi:apolipoprotein N-acyltransferase
VQPLTGLTPYAQLGNYPVVLGALGALIFAGWRRRQGG